MYLHSAVDGFSRLAYTEALSAEKASTAIGFMNRARACFAAHGSGTSISVVTANGSRYRAMDSRMCCIHPGEGSPVFVGVYRLFGSSGAVDIGPLAALGPEPRHVAAGVGHRAHADYMITNLDWHVSYRAPSLGVGLHPETLSAARLSSVAVLGRPL